MSDDVRLLAGVTVVSLAVNLPGPVAAARLRDMGATVHKIEPAGGDPLHAFCPAWYAQLVDGVDVRQEDLKSEEGQAALHRLLAEADILITATRPAALARLGLGWHDLHARHPRLCHVAIVGQPRPLENVPGHDLTYVAAHGLVSPPQLPRTLIADLGGALLATNAALGLLVRRGLTGEAGCEEVALSDAAELFATPAVHGITTSTGLLGGAFPAYGVYAARDGWLAVAAIEPHFLARLQSELAPDGLTHDRLAAVFATRDAAEWVAWAAERDLPIAEVSEPTAALVP